MRLEMSISKCLFGMGPSILDVGKFSWFLTPTLGLTPWNLSCFEFKIPINIRIILEIFFHCTLTLLNLCLVGCLSLTFLNWDSQQGRDLAMSGHNKQKFQLGQSYSYVIWKGWYHQIWIQNNLDFRVLILTYLLHW